MKRLFAVITTLLLAGCTSFGEGNPYEEALRTIRVQAVYPAGYEEFARSGVAVTAREISSANTYVARTDAAGGVTFRMPAGIYRISVADRANALTVFNGSLEEVRLTAEMDLRLPLVYSRAGSIVFKELYFGGCSKAPEDGRIFNDQYVILHNNDSEVQYLDGLCFGAVDPAPSSAVNNWVTKTESGELVFQAFAPINECVWRFKGSGTDFPLAPGEDAVVALMGAVDFAAEFPLSVNLNKAGYFVCFSRQHFPHEKLNPSPGDQIQPSHILDVPKQTGGGGSNKAYSVSIMSPALVIFRPEQGFDLDAYLADDSRSVATVPGGSTKCVKVPWEWILDGVEVFYSTNNNKRIAPVADAGAFPFSVNYQGHTIHRLLDEEATEKAGYAIYTDTNNSSNDFEERPTQSLHE